MRGDGVDERALFLEAIVEVGGGRQTRRSDTSDELALANVRAGEHREDGQVQILCLVAVGVAQMAMRPAPPLTPAETTTPSATATTGAPAGAR